MMLHDAMPALPEQMSDGLAPARKAAEPDGERKPRWPQHDADEIEAAAAVLRAGRVNSLVHGDQCRAFEEEFAGYCGAPFAISLANGTVALELALRALGVGPGHEVIVPARSFFASASCIVAVGATPVLADIDPQSHNIDVEAARALIGPRTRAIICVHLAGWPCAKDELGALADEHGLWLVEDCAQAHGAAIGGRRVGSFGHAAAFSFCTDKIMSTGGEGGVLLLHDRRHWERAWAYKDHGKNPAKALRPVPGSGFRWVHDGFGTNFRMTEFQAAIGRIQLTKLDGWLGRRRVNATHLQDRLADHPLVRVPRVPPHVHHAYYKFYFLLELEGLAPRMSAADVIAALVAMGVPASGGCCPDMGREAAFAALGAARPGEHPVADDVGRRSVMLPVDHLLDAADMEGMAAAVMSVLDGMTLKTWKVAP